ncbi:MAG: HD domain-containing phosphohydrolase [Flavobacteriales bacterium]
MQGELRRAAAIRGQAGRLWCPCSVKPAWAMQWMQKALEPGRGNLLTCGSQPRRSSSLARLKTADDYTYMHSVAVCALMVALARQLGLSDAHTRTAGMAGLLHDLGKAAIPMAVLNKPGKLTDAEFTVVRSHPVEGYHMLKEGGGVEAAVLDACLHHHEKIDGTGYPDKLKGDKISLIARMAAIWRSTTRSPPTVPTRRMDY